MKHIIKCTALMCAVILFCAIGEWVEAMETSENATKVTNPVAVKNTVPEQVAQVTPPADDTTKELSTADRATIRSEQKAITDNLYKNTVASVRVGNGLHPEERTCVDKRKPKIKSALEKLLNKKITDKQLPTIAIISGGGGYEAMLATAGLLNGADKIGLLDAVAYIAAESGSVWALAPWISTGMKLSQFRSYIAECITKKFEVSNVSEAKNIVDMISVKIGCDQPVTMVDLYGGILANRLLKHYRVDAQRVHMSDQADRVKSGDYPYPIYSAAYGCRIPGDMHRLEFTPHEIGVPQFGLYVPSWAYGRQFEDGKTIDFSPEQSLGFIMATSGSAHSGQFRKIWDEITEKMPQFLVKPLIEKQLVAELEDASQKSFCAQVFNFMFGMKNQEVPSEQTLKIAQAGSGFNLAYSSVSGERPERKADILIYLDSSLDDDAGEFKKCEEYARKKGLKYPTIDYSGINEKTISVFKDEKDFSVPVVIYLPIMSDAALWKENQSKSEFNNYTSLENFNIKECLKKGFCKQGNFQYELKQSQKILDQVEFNIMINKDTIINALNWFIDHKK